MRCFLNYEDKETHREIHESALSFMQGPEITAEVIERVVGVYLRCGIRKVKTAIRIVVIFSSGANNIGVCGFSDQNHLKKKTGPHNKLAPE